MTPTSEANQTQQPLISPKIKRHGWLVIVAMILGGVWSSVKVMREPDSFVSYGRMYVSGRVNIPDASSAYSEELSNYLGTQAEIMQSQAVLQRSQERLLLERPELKGNASIHIEILKGTSIFSLSAQGSDSEYVRCYLDSVMDEFIRFKRERRIQTSQDTIERIASEIKRLDKECQDQEQELLTFQQHNNISFWEQQSVSSAHFLSDLKSREASLKMQLSAQEAWEKIAKDQSLSSSMAQLDTNGDFTLLDSPELSQARQKLDTLNIELEELKRFLKPAHPKVQRLTDDRDKQQRLIALMMSNYALRQKERRAAMTAELKSIQEAITEWDGKSLESSRIEGEYSKLKSSLDRTRDLYGRMVASLQNIDVLKQVDNELVQILQKASPSSVVDRNLRSRVFVGMFWGGAIGFGLFVLIGRMDDRTYTAEEAVDYLKCRSLAEVPLKLRSSVSKEKRRHSETSFIEAFRHLRSILFLSGRPDEKMIFLVTSALPGEGKSEVALNLAQSCALVGKKVLLIDADLRRGRLHMALNLASPEPGMSEWLSGEADIESVIQPTKTHNLDVISRGMETTRASEWFASSEFCEKLQGLKQIYDVIVMDSAPIRPVDDTNQLVPLAASVLFVVRMRQTPLGQARKALQTLQARGAKDVGLIFNRVSQEHARYYYSYYGPKSS